MSLHQLVLEKTAQMLDIPDEKAGAEREGRTWTRKEELGHLIDSAMNNHNHIVRAALDGEYTGPGYDQDGWVDMNAYNEMGWVVIVFLWRDLNLQLSRVIDPCATGLALVALYDWREGSGDAGIFDYGLSGTHGRTSGQNSALESE